MPARVVDASVLAAVAFQEPRFDEAATLLEDAEIHAPTLLAYELTSVARKKAMLYPGLVEGLVANLEDVLSIDLHWVEVDHREVLDLSLDTGLTTYDASYLYVSLLLDLPLVTFDEQLQRVSRKFGSQT